MLSTYLQNIKDIGIQQLKDISEYDFFVFFDSEYFKLSTKEELELLQKYHVIYKSGFVLYYRKKDR